MSKVSFTRHSLLIKNRYYCDTKKPRLCREVFLQLSAPPCLLTEDHPTPNGSEFGEDAASARRCVTPWYLLFNRQKKI